MNYKKIIITVFIVALIVGLGIWILNIKRESGTVTEEPISEEKVGPKHQVIGKSVEGREIESYSFLPALSTARPAGGNGQKHLLFVGGIHGGYEWNSVLLAYEFIDYLKENPDAIPDDLTVSIIPSANPDGIFEVIGQNGRFKLADVPKTKNETGLGRFNARGVDLNRNFDCKWQPESMWRQKKVSAGTKPFSEPESAALRDFVLENDPVAVVFWHSQSNAVYASECEEGILSQTLQIMNAYSKASGYPAVESFEHYEITGDAEGWLAKIGIPAITVELKTHETIEWDQNLAGVKAIFEFFSE